MKLIKDYEVEGGWCVLKRINRCRNCGVITELVPESGHFNSQYWKLQRDDGCLLYCCPNGCSEKEALIKMREFLKIRGWCKKGSESYNYKFDLESITDAWIDTEGRIYPLSDKEHLNFARSIDKTEIELEKAGWIKITSLEILWNKSFTQKQIDVLFDFISAHNEGKVKEFSKIMEAPLGIFTLGAK